MSGTEREHRPVMLDGLTSAAASRAEAQRRMEREDAERRIRLASSASITQTPPAAPSSGGGDARQTPGRDVAAPPAPASSAGEAPRRGGSGRDAFGAPAERRTLPPAVTERLARKQADVPLGVPGLAELSAADVKFLRQLTEQAEATNRNATRRGTERQPTRKTIRTTTRRNQR